MNETQAAPAPSATSFLFLPVGALLSSATNPRRRQDPEALAELAESVQQLGVLEPVLVRPLAAGEFTSGQAYEVIAGSRRVAAARKAGLSEVPCRVLDLTDDQVLEVQIVENLQRKDIDPLDEANGFAALLETRRYDVAAIAARVGKSEAYVRQRVSLRNLSPDLQELLNKDAIKLGHAILLAPLGAEEQKQAREWLADDTAEGDQYALVPPVRELKDYLLRMLRDLKKAAWPLKDAKLFEAAGPCTLCPKRSGAQAGLFEEAKGDHCLDAACWDVKAHAFLERTRERKPDVVTISTTHKATEDGSLNRRQYTEIRTDLGVEPCGKAVKAIVSDGDQLGTEKLVCKDPKCSRHGFLIADKGDGKKKGKAPLDDHQEKYRQEERDREAKVKTERDRRRALYRQILDEVTSGRAGPAECLDVAVRGLIAVSWSDSQKLVAQALGIKGHAEKDFLAYIDQTPYDAKNLLRVGVALGLARDLMVFGHDTRAFKRDTRLDQLADAWELEVPAEEKPAAKKAGKPAGKVAPKPKAVKAPNPAKAAKKGK